MIDPWQAKFFSNEQHHKNPEHIDKCLLVLYAPKGSSASNQTSIQRQMFDEPEFSPKGYALVPETDRIPGDLRINCQYGEQIVDTLGIPWILVKVFSKRWARKKK